MLVSTRNDEGPTVPRPLLPKFSCLAYPSGNYRAGTIIRTVNMKSGVSPDELVLAFSPVETPIAAPYVDFTEQVSSGVSTSLTGKALEKIGIKLDANADIKYQTSVSGMQNTDYVMNDDDRLQAFTRLLSSSARIGGARYFYIKEALGSQTLDYKVSQGAQFKGQATLLADKSGLGVDINAFTSSKSVSSRRELIACVVLEEVNISRGGGPLDVAIVPRDSPDLMNLINAKNSK